MSIVLLIKKSTLAALETFIKNFYYTQDNAGTSNMGSHCIGDLTFADSTEIRSEKLEGCQYIDKVYIEMLWLLGPFVDYMGFWKWEIIGVFREITSPAFDYIRTFQPQLEG